MIKISHINPTDIKGGASLAGYRLHKEFLKESEACSILFVDKKYSKDKEVVQFSNFVLRFVEAILNKINYFLGLQYFFSVNWLGLLLRKRFWQTDIFIIRMIHGSYLPFWFPWFLSKIAPVVWRLPDMWAFTGHCSYSYDCQKFKSLCHACPYLKEYPGLFIDTTSLLFKLKKFFYQKSKISIVCPSRWLLSEIRQSPVFGNTEAFLISTGVDENKFFPQKKYDKPSLLAVLVDLKDKRKGGQIFPLILKILNERLVEKNIFIDFYWVGKEYKKSINREAKLSNINSVFLGNLNEEELTKYYSRCHVYLLPTLADNLPNTLLESLACETPAVSFNVGGCNDVIKHLETGYLAKPNDINDFVAGVLKVLENYEGMGKNGRELILDGFTMKQQKEKYLELIKTIYGRNQK